MTQYFNRKEEKAKRRMLRNNMTEAERILWVRLKRRQIMNKRFLRQFSIGKYVVDFYCPEIKLAIEVDGKTHCTKDELEYDRKRQNEIEELDIKFLRFTNEEVFGSVDKVVADIEYFIEVITNEKCSNSN